MSSRGGVKCPTCGRHLGDDLIGLYATRCPRCHEEARWIVYGERRIEDEFGVTTVTVERTEKPAPAA